MLFKQVIVNVMVYELKMFFFFYVVAAPATLIGVRFSQAEEMLAHIRGERD